LSRIQLKRVNIGEHVKRLGAQEGFKKLLMADLLLCRIPPNEAYY